MTLNTSTAQQFFLALQKENLELQSVSRSLEIMGHNLKDIFGFLPPTQGVLEYVFENMGVLVLEPSVMAKIINFSSQEELVKCLCDYYYTNVHRKGEDFYFSSAQIPLILEKIEKFKTPNDKEYGVLGRYTFLNYYIAEYKALKKSHNLLLSSEQLLKLVKSTPLSYDFKKYKSKINVNTLQTYLEYASQAIVPFSEEAIEYMIKNMPNIDKKIPNYTKTIMQGGCTSLFKVLDTIEKLTGHNWKNEKDLWPLISFAKRQSVEYIIRNKVVDVNSEKIKKSIMERSDAEYFSKYIEKCEIKTEKSQLAKNLTKLTTAQQKNKIVSKVNKI